MDRRLKRWEVALMTGILIALLTGGWLGQERQDLADSVIRLHVLANSDSAEDQSLKLAVRDAVLAQVEAIYPPDATLDEAYETLERALDSIAAAGEAVVGQWGYDYPVMAELTKCWFPTKEYDEFALPAGQYHALRVVIGEGGGQNWWCVAFPPLCVGAASETVADATEAGLFTEGQAALITGENEGYVIKFKAMELLGGLFG